MVQLNLTTLSPSLVARFWAKVAIPEDPSACWLWTASLDMHGYGRLKGSKSQRHIVRAHRVSWELHNGPIPDGLEVCHHCDNPPCVRPDHLWLGTHKANIQDASHKDRMAAWKRSGEQNGKSKLTEADVRIIRQQYAQGSAVARELAHQFGVHIQAIYDVRNRRTWPNVLLEP